jgi:hypothetical protein
MHYIAETLLIDAKAAIERSKLQQKIGHPGLRGVLREEILLAFMEFRVPHFVLLGKGTIIDSQDRHRHEGEDDVILYDKEITPPIKMYSGSTNGVYHFNGVLGRVEVKSSLEAKDYTQFVQRSHALTQFKVDVRHELVQSIDVAYNYLFAFDSIARSKCEIQRFYEACEKNQIDPLSGVASVLCILGKAIYRLHGDSTRRFWQVARADDSSAHQLVRFASMVSEMSLRQHIIRTARKIEDSLEISVGNYLWDPQWEDV